MTRDDLNARIPKPGARLILCVTTPNQNKFSYNESLDIYLKFDTNIVAVQKILLIEDLESIRKSGRVDFTTYVRKRMFYNNYTVYFHNRRRRLGLFFV